MKNHITSLLLFIAIGLTMGKMEAQQTQKKRLIKLKPVQSSILPNEKHQYKVSLKKNQFAFFKLIQNGVDVIITTFNPAGKKLQEFDTPNGPNGPELFTINSTDKGDYLIEVAQLSKKKTDGFYQLKAEKIQPKAVKKHHQVDELFTTWNLQNAPGAAVAIVKDGSIVYAKGYGDANLEYNVPVSSTSIFHIASVSKQFTVFSILLLEEQGKLSLDDDIRKFIPEVPDFGKKITLRHLASHTSGLRDQWNLLAMAGWRLDDVITKDHVLKLVQKQQALNFEPGSAYTYCNTGFTLLAEVVARVSNMSFAAFTKQAIFKPLQMNNTLFYDDHEKIVKNRAYSYYSSNNGYKKSVLNYANVGATSLFTTVEDLSKWAINFGTHKVGNSKLFKIMNTKATLNNGKTFGGALGQFVGKYKGIDEIQHGGADAGYRSYLTRFPTENFSVIVFGNSAEFNAGNMAHKVADIYLKDKITLPKKIEITPKKNLDTITVPANVLNTYNGDFELQPGFIIQIRNNNGSLTAKATGQTVVSLIPISASLFKVTGVDAKIEFIPNKNKNIVSLQLHQGGRVMKAQRVKEFDITSVNLTEFSGSYYSEELSTTYHFSIADKNLVSTHSRLNDFNLIPIKKDVFSGDVWFFRQVRFIRDKNNKITGCKVSNGRVRNLDFKKIK